MYDSYVENPKIQHRRWPGGILYGSPCTVCTAAAGKGIASFSIWLSRPILDAREVYRKKTATIGYPIQEMPQIAAVLPLKRSEISQPRDPNNYSNAGASCRYFRAGGANKAENPPCGVHLSCASYHLSHTIHAICSPSYCRT
jgi:hypothetical protein